MNIDLLTLKLFVAVVEEQGVAKAAERAHIAASAVSKRIADLEKAAKVQLFRRHRTGLHERVAVNQYTAGGTPERNGSRRVRARGARQPQGLRQ